ncbi:MAG: transposase domain-containing protein [Oscillospiraceae bacterium]
MIDTIESAKSYTIIYSITETTKANNLNPFRYLEYLLTELVKHQEDTYRTFIDNLLPQSNKLPEICRANNKK